MYMMLAIAVTCGAFSLSASVPVANRFIPSFEVPIENLANITSTRPLVSLSSRVLHASHASPLTQDQYETYAFDGLMEMDGLYDLHEIVAAAKEATPDFVSPFTSETGGNTLMSRQLLFGARSSVTAYATALNASMPLGKGISAGLSVPLWHVEARQRYDFPVMTGDYVLSQPQREQAQRFRQMLHQNLEMVQRDWVVNAIGDVSCWAEATKTWHYWWLLRTMQWAVRLSASAPTAPKEDLAYPSSFALGNRGSWGFGIGLHPRFEIKECIWLQLPFSVLLQTPSTFAQRLPAYAEPRSFGVLQGVVKTTPGITLRFEPTLTLQHFLENLHVLVGLSWSKHFADKVVDLRQNPETPSYLTRSSLPEGAFGSTLSLADQRRRLDAEISRKRAFSAWHTTHLMACINYELADIFTKMKYPPMITAGLQYCIGTKHAAKMHQVHVGLSWRF